MKVRCVCSVLGIASLAWTLCGCHSGETKRDVIRARDPIPYVPRANSANAFDAYALAALDAQDRAKTYMGRVSFFPDQKTTIAKEIAPCIKAVSAATKLDCAFQFVPHRPFQLDRYQNGWRLIGRVLQWNVENDCQNGNFDSAISQVCVGTKFGFDLAGGGATDASLGFVIVDNLRKAMVQYLNKLSPVQLDRLARGVKDALEKKPPIVNVLKNEGENMLQTVQFIQECVLKDDLKVLQKNMGNDVNDAVRYLDQIKTNSKKTDAFFDTLERDATEEFRLVELNSSKPLSQRKWPKTELVGTWKKLPKHILGTARPIVDMHDATLARTKLLILYAEVTRFEKEKKPYPADLSAFTPELTMDPYSGVSFLYHADPAEFSIYSVGKNGTDDGGDSDDTFSFPDLKLEIGPR